MSNDDTNHPIKIGHIGGDFIYSNNQKGGITGNINNPNKDPNKKRFYKKLGFLITIFASLIGILTYFGIKPYIKPETNHISHIKASGKPDSQIFNHKIASDRDSNNLQSKHRISRIQLTKQKRKMNQDEKQEPISIDKVARDVVISNNQTGGITAHTVIVGNPKPELRHLNQEDKDRLNVIASEGNIMIWRSMNDEECINYSEEIISYLKSIGRNNLQLSVYGQMFGAQSPRFNLASNGNDFTLTVSVQ
ncbi:MAG: hypothetical protein JWP37_1732 [Mucilaginibacter sp.]|nr:hypothetical protein [Mucilaginibacter sp.]